MTVQTTQATLTVKLEGADEDHGAPRLRDFLSFGESVSKCLKRIEDLVSPQQERIQYRVVDLRPGSAVVTLEAIPPRETVRDSRREVIAAFRETVACLEQGCAIDSRLNFDDLKAFRELVGPLGRHGKRVWIEDVELTTQFAANIDRALSSAIESEGFVKGRLELINVHNRREFVLYPPVSGFRIVCEFPESEFEKVQSALKRNVSVAGTMSFHPEKAFPERVKVKDIEILPDDSQLPTLAELRGTSRGATGKLSSTEFVRAIRDDGED